MKHVNVDQAVEALPSSGLTIFQGGAAEAKDFHQSFANQVERFDNLTVCTGFSFGNYEFLQRGLGEHISFLTWQTSPKLRHHFKENDPKKVRFVPIRLGDVHRVISDTGELKPDAVVIQTSRPLDDGTVSLGISVGPNLDFIRSASLVIAEMNSNMPVTYGESRVPLDDIDVAYESDTPLCEFHAPGASAVDRAIVDSVMSLIPDGAWTQVGIGSVPELVMAELANLKDINLLSGLLTGGLQQFVENAPYSPEVIAGELAGTRAFYEFCHHNEHIKMAPTSYTHDVAKVAALPKFTSVNSALEIDLMGQSNGEALGSVQISGVGGALDYTEAANWCTDGISIIALPSSTHDGKHSKIVANLPTGGVVTVPRYCTDYVVTEYGIAKLKGRDLHRRAEALVEIAHPNFRDSLAEAIK
ncbi:MAG: acetyl-CoA hydrolase/transferase C-terminal domain-containing protein [Pseudomonadota bacterium]